MDWAELRRRFRVWSGDFVGMEPTVQFDRAQWFDAAMQKQRPRPWDYKTTRTYLMARNTYRWHRLQKDIDYFQKQLRRAKIYEDVRDYL